MKINKTHIWTLIALVATAAVYRVIPNRPLGFAPQIAIALFGGAIFKEKRWAFALPLLSMFISDVLYQVLYNAGYSSMQGFYEGQWENYLLFAGITLLGFTMKKKTVASVAAYSVTAPTLFYLVSNFMVWLGGGIDITTNLPLSKSFAGLMQSYVQALPFYYGGLLSTILFSAVLFGGYYFFTRHQTITANA